MTTSALPLATPITPDLVFGAVELDLREGRLQPHRLPLVARRQNTDPQLAMAEAQPSGVRLRFRTKATAIELITRPTKRDYIGMPPRPDGVYDLCIDGDLVRQASASGGTVLKIDVMKASFEQLDGDDQHLRFDDLPGHEKTVEIWLPHDETTELAGLRSDAPLDAVPRGTGRTWVHHGSSISQGSNAASPTGIWPVIAARGAGVDLINLGFGGSALLDPFTARAMRDTEADLISVKIGINLVNGDLMRKRAFGPAVEGFLDTIREGHATTPILVISPLYCAIHEETPGPAQFDLDALAEGRIRFKAEGKPEEVAAGKLTLSVIRDMLQAIIARRTETDANIHYLDGRTLYGEADAARFPLPDALHPDAAAHRLIGERFMQQVFETGAFS